MSITDQGPIGDGDPADDDSFQATSPTSAKQVEANRANAKKSTGPRTPEGKAASARNSLKHGVFATTIEPIADGSEAEEPEVLWGRVEGLVESLGPRDALERELAVRIAGIFVRLSRLDRWIARAADRAMQMGPSDLEAGAGQEAEALDIHEIACQVEAYIGGGADYVGRPFPYQTLAEFVRQMAPKRVTVVGLWDDDHTPSTEDEWKGVLEAIVEFNWPDRSDARSWVGEHVKRTRYRLAQVAGLEEAIGANRVLDGAFRLELEYAAKLGAELQRLYVAFVSIQARGR